MPSYLNFLTGRLPSAPKGKFRDGKRNQKNSAEEGRILILSLGLIGVSLLLIVGIISVTALYLQRQRLASLADTIATGAAEVLDAKRYFLDSAFEARIDAKGNMRQGLPLAYDEAKNFVTTQLNDAQSYADLAWRNLALGTLDMFPDGALFLRIHATARLPLLGPVLSFFGSDVEITASATARSR